MHLLHRSHVITRLIIWSGWLILHCTVDERGSMMSRKIQAGLAIVTVPWGAFVAAFLYYTLLAMIALGGVSPSLAVVATAYLVPVVALAVLIASRLVATAAHAGARGVLTVAPGHS